jgi:hypothetical protein
MNDNGGLMFYDHIFNKTQMRFALLIVLLILALVSFLVISDPRRTLDTPSLIERAFNRGEITAEQKWLYLTYAIYEYESLPTRYWGKVPWEGTFTLVEVYGAVHSPSVFCNMSPYVQNEFRRLLRPDTICN